MRARKRERTMNYPERKNYREPARKRRARDVHERGPRPARPRARSARVRNRKERPARVQRVRQRASVLKCDKPSARVQSAHVCLIENHCCCLFERNHLF